MSRTSPALLSALKNHEKGIRAYGRLEGDAGRQCRVFARLVHPVELNIKSFLLPLVRDQFGRKVVGEVLREACEDVQRSNIEDLCDPMCCVSGFQVHT